MVPREVGRACKGDKADRAAEIMALVRLGAPARELEDLEVFEAETVVLRIFSRCLAGCRPSLSPN
jgi:hypothetical protein